MLRRAEEASMVAMVVAKAQSSKESAEVQDGLMAGSPKVCRRCRRCPAPSTTSRRGHLQAD